MIDAMDQTLKTWAEDVISDVPISLLPPGREQQDSAVIVYLYDLSAATPVTAGRRPPLQFQLHYLVLVQDKDPEIAHRRLGQLLYAALEHAEFSVDLEPVPVDFWRAFNVAPQPAFRLSLPLRIERKQSDTLIRMPMQLNQSALVSLAGIVLGPDDTPLANARVELGTHRLDTHTDHKGRFLFPSVPALPRSKNITVKARNRVFQTQAELHVGSDKPLIIHFDAIGG